MAFPVGAAFLGGASLLGSFGNILSNSAANKANARQAELNRQFSERMLDKQNAYNSPESQAAMYRAAGLNPALMMTGMSSAGSGVSGSDVGRQESMDFSGMSQGLGSAVDSYLQAELNESVINKNNSEARGQELANEKLQQDVAVNQMMNELNLSILFEDLHGKELFNKIKELEHKYLGKTLDSRVEIVNQQAQQEIVRTAIADLERDIKANEFNLSKKQLQYFDQEAILRLANLRKEGVLLMAQAYSSRSQGDLNGSLKTQAEELANKYKAEAKRLGLSDKEAQRLVNAEIKRAEADARQAVQNARYGMQYEGEFGDAWRVGLNTTLSPLGNLLKNFK